MTDTEARLRALEAAAPLRFGQFDPSRWPQAPAVDPESYAGQIEAAEAARRAARVEAHEAEQAGARARHEVEESRRRADYEARAPQRAAAQAELAEALARRAAIDGELDSLRPPSRIDSGPTFESTDHLSSYKLPRAPRARVITPGLGEIDGTAAAAQATRARRELAELVEERWRADMPRFVELAAERDKLNAEIARLEEEASR